MNFERRFSWWPGLVWGSLVTVVIVPGCIDGSGSTSDADSGPTSGTSTGPEPMTSTSTGPGPTTSPYENCETGMEQTTGPDPDCETDSDPSSSETGPVVDPWSDVPCGDVTCTGNEVCVVPGLDCDYSPCRQDMEAEWIMGDPECQPFPEHCDAGNPRNCLEAEYCGPGSEFGSFVDGVLECGPIALDCYCF